MGCGELSLHHPLRRRCAGRKSTQGVWRIGFGVGETETCEHCATVTAAAIAWLDPLAALLTSKEAHEEVENSWTT